LEEVVKYQIIHLSLIKEFQLTLAEVLVLSKIRSLENKKFQDTCIARYENIGSFIGMTERSVAYNVKKLQQKGLIQTGEYLNPNSPKKSYLKTWWKKTTDLVQDSISNSLYIKIPQEILESQVLNAANKFYFGLITYLRDKYNIDSTKSISYKDVAEYFPCKKRTYYHNLDTLKRIGVLDELCYSKFNQEDVLQKIQSYDCNAIRGRQATLSIEEKKYLLTLEESAKKQFEQDTLQTKRINKQFNKKDRSIIHTLDLTFVETASHKTALVELKPVYNKYSEAMIQIRRSQGVVADDFEKANKEFKNSPYNLVKRTNRRKEFIIAHADAIRFAIDYRYMEQFQNNYFHSLYEYFPEVFDNLGYNTNKIQDHLVKIGVVKLTLLTWVEEFAKEFGYNFTSESLDKVVSSFSLHNINYRFIAFFQKKKRYTQVITGYQP